MSKNSTKVFMKLVENMISGAINERVMIRLEHYYGKWGLYLATHVTPYVWILPLLTTILLLVVFKRTGLNGPTQKCLSCILAFDVTYTTFTAIRDTTLKFMDVNYGSLEYQICRFFMIGHRIQSIFHMTSLWIKCFMLIHQTLLFLFPFKVRLINFKKILIPLSVFHVIICVLYFYTVILIPIKGIPTIQDFVLGKPLKKIVACAYHGESIVKMSPFFKALGKFSIFTQFYGTVLPILGNCFCTFYFIILVRKELKLLSIMQQNITSNQAKYITLMKVTLSLGISFIIQEIPVLIGSFYVLRIVITDAYSDFEEVEKVNGVVLFQVFISFWLGKPVDCFIYASLSKIVRNELIELLRLYKIKCIKS